MMEHLDKIIGINIKRLRERMGMTQEDVAAYLGINSREMLSYYEQGTRPVPMSTLDRLATLFYVDVADLMEESESIAQTNVAFAFRADNLDKESLSGIAHFHKVVKNYMKLHELKKNKLNHE